MIKRRLTENVALPSVVANNVDTVGVDKEVEALVAAALAAAVGTATTAGAPKMDEGVGAGVFDAAAEGRPNVAAGAAPNDGVPNTFDVEDVDNVDDDDDDDDGVDPKAVDPKGDANEPNAPPEDPNGVEVEEAAEAAGVALTAREREERERQ